MQCEEDFIAAGGVASGAEKALAVADALRLVESTLAALPTLRDECALVPTGDLARVMSVMSALAREAGGVRVALLDEAVARGVPGDAGFASPRAWLADCDPLLPQQDLGAAVKCLEETSPPALAGLRTAVIEGRVGPSDAVRAARVVTQLAPVVAPASGIAPDGSALTAHDVAERRRHLVDDAITLCATGLGKRDLAAFRTAVLARYAPQHQVREIAHDAERMSLSAFRLRPDGMYEADLVLDGHSTAVVRALPISLAAPAPDPETGTPDRRTAGQRRAQALVEITRRAAAAGATGPMGGSAKVLLTATLGELTTLQATGRTSAGQSLAQTVVEALTCDADVVTVATTAEGHVLDAGRTTRLATARQRDALAVRDGGCTFPGCDRPPEWTQAHHLQHWAHGGGTDMGNLALLCSRHHTFVHHHDIAGEVVTPPGGPQFVRWHVIRTRSGWRPAPPSPPVAAA